MSTGKITMEPGVYYDVPFDQYLRIDALSSTKIRAFLVSPRHYIWSDRTTFDPSAARIGRATHTAILEPMRLLREYVLWDERSEKGNVRPRRGKDFDAFCAAHPGKCALIESEYRPAERISQLVRENEEAAAQFSGGRSEITLVWKHEKSGRLIKVRLDYQNDDADTDLKTSGKQIDTRGFSRTAGELRYFVQGALYSDASTALFGRRRPFRFVAAQKSAPYASAVHEMTEDQHMHGTAMYERAIEGIAECEKTNKWPGPCPGINKLEIPEFYFDTPELDWEDDAA